MSKCYLCPRACGVDRASGERGFCNEGDEIRIARYSLHKWEEPPISGERGSGTIFFGGCNLRCEFCQNMAISHSQSKGIQVREERFEEIIFELVEMGAENINLVTPTHFAHKIVQVLSRIKSKLPVPVVYNSSGYESIETIKMLDGLVDVYLPDFKYFSDELSKKYSLASNYRASAEVAICEMYRQVGSPVIDNRGIMQKGLIIRHLVLPSCRHDSIAVIKRIAELLPKKDYYISLMSQYTPDFARSANTPHTELHRKLTTFEYSSVLSCVQDLELDGFLQDKSSSTADYTPNF